MSWDSNPENSIRRNKLFLLVGLDLRIRKARDYLSKKWEQASWRKIRQRQEKMASGGASVTTTMIAAQIVEVGGETLMKAATKDGMSIFIFIVYSNLLALCFLLPSTLFHHRKRAPPPISTSIFCRIFVFGCLRYEQS